MERKTYKCNLVTPMLMHGEDTDVAELRPPSIKGAMRFWWRAIHGNLSLEELKKQESVLFGGVGDSAVQSSFRIKLLTRHLITTQANPLPHRQNGRFTISGYQENQNFELEFIAKDLQIIEKIFELTTILGSFGQRARRGFGSIQIQNDINIGYVKKLISEINSNFNYQSDNGYPYITSIDIGKEYRDMNDLIRTISLATHNHNGDGMFGSVRGGRYASPLYISIVKVNNNYRPIITTLNATKRIDKERLNKFKGAIL